MKKLYRILFMAMLAAGAATQVAYAEVDDRIETVVDACCAVPVDGGINLVATEQTNFEIYSITGQRVKSVAVSNESIKVDLPKGCYIVRCAKWSKKVLVK